jgi:hypothetical protein
VVSLSRPQSRPILTCPPAFQVPTEDGGPGSAAATARRGTETRHPRCAPSPNRLAAAASGPPIAAPHASFAAGARKRASGNALETPHESRCPDRPGAIRPHDAGHCGRHRGRRAAAPAASQRVANHDLGARGRHRRLLGDRGRAVPGFLPRAPGGAAGSNRGAAPRVTLGHGSSTSSPSGLAPQVPQARWAA